MSRRSTAATLRARVRKIAREYMEQVGMTGAEAVRLARADVYGPEDVSVRQP